jgi:hemerythrin-like domain-containing protein
VPLTYVHLLGEYLALEAQMQAGESVDHQQQKDIVDRINELYNHVQRLKQKFGQKIIEAVESLRQQARRLGDPQQEGQRTMSDGWRRQTAKLALELFGFSDIPTKAELKKRRNDLARAHHPDVATDQSDATELMQQVNKAFDVLNGLLDDR